MVGYWEAIYNDGTTLPEKNVDGTENFFRDINQEKLIAFRLTHNDKELVVDLTNGMFMVNGTVFEIPGLSNVEGLKYRLIYFRRVRQEITLTGESAGETVEPYIGYQVTKDGHNHKFMFSVDDTNAVKIRLGDQ